MEDTEFTDGTMNGKSFKSGRFAGSMRRYLMREHLGLLDEKDKEESEELVMDPICDNFYKDIWLRQACVNTKYYDDAFLVVPTDKVKTVEECHRYEQRRPLAEFDRVAAKRILNNVKVIKLYTSLFEVA